MGSSGPIISDNETERLAKGFAFSNVITVEICFKVQKFEFDITPKICYVSNSGFSSLDNSFNRKNIAFGLSFHFLIFQNYIVYVILLDHFIDKY